MRQEPESEGGQEVTRRRTHLDLFSGIGGFAIAAEWAGYQTVAFCECETFCQRILAKRFPAVPIHGDIREFDGGDYQGVDLLTGGFPCQPYSITGNQRGAEDDRALGSQMVRVVSEARPSWVIGENVAHFEKLGLDEMLFDLAGLGYEVQAFRIGAVAVGAPHRRDRIWIVGRDANTDAEGERAREPSWVDQEEGSQASDVPRSDIVRQDVSASIGEAADLGGDRREWGIEPDLRRVAHGIPDRSHRLAALGNAIVPQVAYELIQAIP